MELYIGPLGGPIHFANAAAFLTEPARVFGDSDEEATATRKMKRLRQGNRAFERYCADFTHLATILEDTDKTQRHALERGLSADMLDELRHQNAPPDETSNAFVDRPKHLDDSICRTKALRAPGRTGGHWRTGEAARNHAHMAAENLTAAPNRPAERERQRERRCTVGM